MHLLSYFNTKNESSSESRFCIIPLLWVPICFWQTSTAQVTRAEAARDEISAIWERRERHPKPKLGALPGCQSRVVLWLVYRQSYCSQPAELLHRCHHRVQPVHATARWLGVPRELANHFGAGITVL